MASKADHKTDRNQIKDFQQIINVGPSIAGDLKRIGLRTPQQLIGKQPLDLYRKLCQHDRIFHDPCVLDTLISCVEYMDGKPPKQWWLFTEQRKANFSDAIEELRSKFLK